MTTLLQRPQLRPSRLICPLCRDGIEGGSSKQLYACGSCRTAYHRECAAEMGGCSTMGCAQRGQIVRVVIQRFAERIRFQEYHKPRIARRPREVRRSERGTPVDVWRWVPTAMWLGFTLVTMAAAHSLGLPALALCGLLLPFLLCAFEVYERTS